MMSDRATRCGVPRCSTYSERRLSRRCSLSVQDLRSLLLKLLAGAPLTSGLVRCAQNAKLSVEEFQEKVMAASRKACPSHWHGIVGMACRQSA